MEGECVNQFPEQNGDILIGRYSNRGHAGLFLFLEILLSSDLISGIGVSSFLSPLCGTYYERRPRLCQGNNAIKQ